MHLGHVHVLRAEVRDLVGLQRGQAAHVLPGFIDAAICRCVVP
jgi:hypothetical protein